MNEIDTPTDVAAISARLVRDFVLCDECAEFLERSRRAVSVDGIGGVAMRFCEHNRVAGAWYMLKVVLHDCPSLAYYDRLHAEYAREIEQHLGPTSAGAGN